MNAIPTKLTGKAQCHSEADLHIDHFHHSIWRLVGACFRTVQIVIESSVRALGLVNGRKVRPRTCSSRASWCGAICPRCTTATSRCRLGVIIIWIIWIIDSIRQLVQKNTYDSLRNGKITVDVIPQMTVTWINGKWFAWSGNRHLWVYRKLEADAVLDTITVQTIKCEIPRGKFTTQKGGV